MKNFKKYYKINGTPEEVYIALTNAFSISLWSGAEAVMEPIADTEFSLWDGDISGRNLGFVPDKRIEQEWYFGEQEEKSLVTIILHADKANTSVELHHTNIPDEDFEAITDGWDDAYFGSLAAFFDED